MKAIAHQRTSCRLCGATDLVTALPLNPSPVADAYVPLEQKSVKQECYPLDLHLCSVCGHVQLLTVVNPEFLFTNYIYRTANSLGLVEHFNRQAEAIVHRFDCRPGELTLDIGSNDGTLLKVFKNLGFRVLGVDPAREIAKAASEAGCETIPEYFTSHLAETIRERHGEAKVITANNVFAHSDDLSGIAHGIRQLLAPKGVFVFEVSYLVDIVENLLFDTVYHEHLCYHSIKPLVRFFRLHGMELFDVERLPTKGGSIRGFVQLSGGPYPVAPVIPELIALEDKLKLDRLDAYRSLSTRLNLLKNELHGLLSGAKADGKTIAGYGASATVTTLIYHFELGQFLDFLVDDNESRHGLLSPGHHIPIFPPSTLLERKPDYVIVLAWQYATPILGRNQAFLKNGGHFILPAPKVQVV